MYLAILPILLCSWTACPMNGLARAENTTETGNETNIALRKRLFGARGFFLARPGPGADNGSDAIVIEHTDKSNTTIYPWIPRQFPIYPPTSCPKMRSCFGHCASSRQFQNVTLKSMRCFCDPECSAVFRDCCADYEQHCKETGSQAGGEDERKRWRCGKVEGRTFGIWMIAACAQDWPRDEVRLKCENNSSEIILEVNPTLILDDFNNIFRNRDCAKCNNVERFTCLSLERQNSDKNVKKDLFDKNEECPRVSASSKLGIRYCYNTETTCKYTENMDTVNKCRDGKTGLVSFMNETFRNFHCLKCNHRYSYGFLPSKVSCGPVFNVENRFNFAAIFKVAVNTEASTRRCSLGFFYHSTARTCRKLLTISETKLTFLTKYAVQLDYTRNTKLNCFELSKSPSNNLDALMDRILSGFKEEFYRKIELNLRKTNWTLSNLVVSVQSKNYVTLTFEILAIKNETNETDPVKKLNLDTIYFLFDPRNASTFCMYFLTDEISHQMNCLDESNVAITMDKVSIYDNGTLFFQESEENFDLGDYLLYKDRHHTRLATCVKLY